MRDGLVRLTAFGAAFGLVLSLPGVVVAAIVIADARELLAVLPFVLAPFACLGVALVLTLARPGLATRRHPSGRGR